MANAELNQRSTNGSSRTDQGTGRTVAATRGRPARSFVDPATLMRIKNLEVRARVVVEGMFSGLHRSPYHGFSVEFSEYREYIPGDDLRYLDWRLFARSDRYYLKRFEDETNLRCQILLDLSRSMAFGTGGQKRDGYDKATYARTLAATLAYFLSLQRDAVGVMTFADGVSDYVPTRYRPGHLHRLMVCLERAVSGQSTSLTIPLEHAARIITKRGMVVLISDLLAEVDRLEHHLGYLTSQGHDVVLLRVLDPREVDFNFSDPSMFQDMESGKQMYVDPAGVRATYLENFNEHLSRVQKVCNRLGVDFQQLQTDQPLEHALFDFLQHRMQRGKTGSRAVRHSSQGGG